MKEYIKKQIMSILDVKEENIKIEIPPKDNMGDYSIQCANLRNEENKNPLEIAEKIKNNFKDEDKLFKEIKCMGPYVNFYIEYDAFSENVIKEILSNKQYGSLNQGKNEAMLVEHTSINPNAEPHIGRCRNSLIGDFISNLFAFVGYNTEKHYFINDIGKKIALLVIGIEKCGLKEKRLDLILDAYVKISKDAKENESVEEQAFEYLKNVETGDKETILKFKEITDLCVKEQVKIFNKLDIDFDVFTHESKFISDKSIDKILNDLEKTGKLCKDENGRKYVDLSDYNIPTKEPVLVLTRSNGTSLYPLRDIAYTIYKINLNPKNNYIVLGEDQDVYMQQISATLDILGYKAPKLVSYSYVLLNGDKMSTSAGTVVLVTDFMAAVKEKLIEEFKSRNQEVTEEKLNILVNACIKYTMLNISKSKIVNFNLDNATSFNGETGIYILYNIARMKSILKKCDIVLEDKIKYENPIEHKIIKELSLFPEIVDGLLHNVEPAHLTKYIYNLTQLFSKFYEEINILNENDAVLKSSRIKLLTCIIEVLENALHIIGIKSVDSF